MYALSQLTSMLIFFHLLGVNMFIFSSFQGIIGELTPDKYILYIEMLRSFVNKDSFII